MLALALPVALGSAAAPGGSRAASASPYQATATSFLAQVAEVRSDADGRAVLADVEGLAEAVAAPAAPAPTTTTVPPAPPTTAAPAPAPAVQPAAGGSGYNDPSNPAAWDRLAQCESGGSWAANTGNGYYGGIQFSLASWRGVGGTGRPDQASRETQIAMGQRLWHQGGWSQWPACSSQLGYR